LALGTAPASRWIGFYENLHAYQIVEQRLCLVKLI
jgi:hypothetical protein